MFRHQLEGGDLHILVLFLDLLNLLKRVFLLASRHPAVAQEQLISLL